MQYYNIAGLIGTTFSLVLIKFFGRKTLMVYGAAFLMFTLILEGFAVMYELNIFCYICLFTVNLATQVSTNA